MTRADRPSAKRAGERRRDDLRRDDPRGPVRAEGAGEPQGEVWGEDAAQGRVYEAWCAARLRGVLWEAPSPDRPDHRAPTVAHAWANIEGGCGWGDEAQDLPF